MSRQARIISNSGIYHIMIRGINKEKIFKNEIYKIKILEIIKEIKEEIEFAIIAYCVMDNHMHLLIHASEDNLANVMKKINVKYAMYYNRLEKRYGYVFQNRFRSEAVEDDRYMLGALRYIHNNPVKAGISRTIFDYHWSSANDYINENTDIINNNYINEILGLFNNKNKFIQFHNLYDDNLYIDTKEEELKNIQEIIQSTIEQYASKYCIIDKNQISQKQKEELAIKLLSLNITTIKEIATLCNLPTYSVSELKNKLRCDSTID